MQPQDLAQILGGPHAASPNSLGPSVHPSGPGWTLPSDPNVALSCCRWAEGLHSEHYLSVQPWDFAENQVRPHSVSPNSLGPLDHSSDPDWAPPRDLQEAGELWDELTAFPVYCTYHSALVCHLEPGRVLPSELKQLRSFNELHEVCWRSTQCIHPHLGSLWVPPATC